MAKAKKRGLSDKVTNSKSRQGGSTNPFEVKLNRQKHHVLGRKIAKYDKGKPGVSRSKAINKVRPQVYATTMYVIILSWWY